MVNEHAFMNLASLNLNFNLTNFETCQISACFGELAPHSLFGIINVVVAKMVHFAYYHLRGVKNVTTLCQNDGFDTHFQSF